MLLKENGLGLTLGASFTMISMTEYWQQFEECINSLQTTSKDEEFTRQITTAKNLIEIGLKIENMGIGEIMGVADKLHEAAKSYGHETSYMDNNKLYTFYAPKITNKNSLIFTIFYYQHLTNYQKVSYQGSINWLFKGKVTSSINEKKVSTAYRAQAMLQVIRNYCEEQKITLDEALLLRSDQESIKDFTTRISEMINNLDESARKKVETLTHVQEPTGNEKEISNLPQQIAKKEAEICSPPQKPIKKEVEIFNQLSEIASLEQALKNLNDIRDQRFRLRAKSNEIDQKLSVLNQAKQNHSILTNEWQNKSFITQAFYWFISFFIEVTLIKNLKRAEKLMSQAESELKRAFPNRTPESYAIKLQTKQQELKLEQVKLQSEIQQRKERIKISEFPTVRDPSKAETHIEEDKEPIEIKKVNNIVEIKSSPKKELPSKEETSPREKISTIDRTQCQKGEEISSKDNFFSKEDTSYEEEELSSVEEASETSSHYDYYGFFKQYIPNKYYLTAGAVAVAAIVTQTLVM